MTTLAAEFFSDNDETVLLHPTAEAFFGRLTADALVLPTVERRSEPRYAVTMAVPAQPLNDAHERVGESFIAITRSISLHGLAFYYTKPITEKLLAMQFRDRQGLTLVAILQVLRCEPRGPLYEVGGKFIGELAE